MGHLFKFRQGWQSEHLAKYILSKFSFVAEPSTIADDLGTDFFCTLFTTEEKRKTVFLNPQNSFAISIKSNKGKFKMTDKSSYLDDLKIPFFMGIVNKTDLTLTIYSGECLQEFLTKEGFPGEGFGNEELFIQCVNERENPLYDKRGVVKDNGSIILKFPKVVELKVDFNYREDSGCLNELFKICDLMQRNRIQREAGRLNYERYNGDIIRVVGETSFRNFQKYFFESVAEAFACLEWGYNALEIKDKEDIKKKFLCYKKIYQELKREFGNSLSEDLNISFQNAEKVISSVDQNSPPQS